LYVRHFKAFKKYAKSDIKIFALVSYCTDD